MTSQGFIVVCSEANYMRYFDCEFKDLAFNICSDEILRGFVVPVVNEDYEGNEQWYNDKYRNPSKEDVQKLASRYTDVPKIRFYDRKNLEIGVSLLPQF